MRATISIPPRLAYGANGAVPATPGAPDVLVAVANMLHGRVEELCKRTGWSVSTVQKKISLTNETHHFSAAELQIAQHVLGDITPTQVLAAAEGYACIRILPADVSSVSQGLASVMTYLSDYARAVTESTEAGRVPTRNDVRRIDMCLGELLGSANALAAFVRAQVPEAPRGALDA